MSHENIYYVYSMHPHEQTGELHHVLRGKFYLNGGHFSQLENHGMHEEDLESMSPKDAANVIHNLSNSMYYEVANGQHIKEGHYPHLIQKVNKPRVVPANLQDAMSNQLEEGPRVSRFDYHRTGIDAPSAFEIHGNKAYMNGQLLSPEEFKLTLSHIKEGKASLRHRLGKSEEDLFKSEGLSSSKLLHQDTMFPMMGNNKAYKNFLSEAKPGTHIHIDVNDLRHVNHEMGHETGTQALLAVGKAIKHAMDESVGEKHQLFRHGGDKFMAHVPNQEHAAIFARNLSQKLSSIPALRGSHQLSVSIGYGNNPDFAREALKTAKGHKILAGKEKGKADTHVHAYVPASTPIPSM